MLIYHFCEFLSHSTPPPQVALRSAALMWLYLASFGISWHLFCIWKVDFFFLHSLSDSYFLFLKCIHFLHLKDIDLLSDTHFLRTCLYFDYIGFSFFFFVNLLHCADILVLRISSLETLDEFISLKSCKRLRDCAIPKCIKTVIPFLVSSQEKCYRSGI